VEADRYGLVGPGSGFRALALLHARRHGKAAATLGLPEVHDDADGGVGIVLDREDVQVAGRDEAILVEHLVLHPVDQALPVVADHQDDGEVRLAERLDEDRRFEELVHRAVAARKGDEAVGVFQEHHLADEEVAEMQGKVLILVGTCSSGISMLRPILVPPASVAPLLAASMIPAPPPVMTAKPAWASLRAVVWANW
jgi:hypothetical protein